MTIDTSAHTTQKTANTFRYAIVCLDINAENTEEADEAVNEADYKFNHPNIIDAEIVEILDQYPYDGEEAPF